MKFKINQESGWMQEVSFKEGLDMTITWHIDNQDWLDRVKSGEYKKWLEKNYEM